MNKTAMLISIALTTFVLIAIGGVVYVLRPDAAVAAPVEDSSPATEAVVDPAAGGDPTLDPAFEQALQAREAEYQKLIADANTRLMELQQQLATQTVAPQVDVAAATSQEITPEQAAQIAADYIGQTRVYWVQLVTLQGASVYEVTFPAGDIVYVSMTGQVVGSAPAPVFASGNSGGGGSIVEKGSSGGGGGEHGGEHEDDHGGGGDDD